MNIFYGLVLAFQLTANFTYKTFWKVDVRLASNYCK
jgi:hypothetical protein